MLAVSYRLNFRQQITKTPSEAAILRNASHFAKQGDGSCSCL